jgi:hypothetical protein
VRLHLVTLALLPAAVLIVPVDAFGQQPGPYDPAPPLPPPPPPPPATAAPPPAIAAPPSAAAAAPPAEVASDKDDQTADDQKKKDDDEHKNDDRVFEKNCVMALRVSMLSLTGTDHDRSTVGFTLWSEQTKYTNQKWFTARGWGLAGLGGGTGGFEGALGGGGAVGYRARLDEDYGLFMRLGFDGAMIGNQKLYVSWIEVPQGQVGYQYLHDRDVFEVGAHGGPILAGRFNPGDDARRDTSGSLEYGPYLSIHGGFGRIDGTWMHMLATQFADGTPVDVVRGNACLYLGKSFGVCGDFSYMRGHTQWAFGSITSDSTALYGGVLFGFRPDGHDD